MGHAVAASRSTAGLVFLDALGVLPLTKQGEEDPLERDEFTRRMVELATALRVAFRRREAATVSEIEQALAQAWSTIPPADRARALRRVARALADAPRPLRRRVLDRVEAAAVLVARRTREGARRRFRFPIDPRLPRGEARQVLGLAASTPGFIEDEYARRAERWGDVAATAVAAGIAAGLADTDIARRLAATARGLLVRPEYFGGVAAAVLNRARTDSLLALYEEVDVRRYEVRAVLDTRTCVKCRFMHGKRFTIRGGRGLLRRLARLRRVSAIGRANPFLRQGRDAAGRQVIYVPGRRGTRRVVAVVTESAEGRADAVGRFAQAWSADRLAEAGVGPPPYHPLCRCVPVPVLS